MSEIQIIVTLLSLIYIYFAVNNKAIAFVFGFVASCLWAYEDFVHINLKFDGFLQLFYALVSVYGLYSWKYGSENKEEKAISKLSRNNHILIFFSSMIISVIVAFIGLQFFNTALPYLDAITTGFSIVATFLLVQRYIDTWIYWVFIDLAYIYIYGMQSAWLFAALMALYVVLSVQGYFKWTAVFALENKKLSS